MALQKPDGEVRQLIDGELCAASAGAKRNRNVSSSVLMGSPLGGW